MFKSFLFTIVLLLNFSLTFDLYAFKHQEKVDFTVSYYLDTLNVLGVGQLLDEHGARFKVATEPNNINFGYRDVTAWLKITLNSPSKHTNYILNINNAHLDSISFYTFYAQHPVRVMYTGDQYVFNSRSYDYNMFSFTLPDSADFFLLKVRSKGSMIIPVGVDTVEGYMHRANSNVFLFSLFFGLLLLALVINILLYFRVSEKIYFYYVLCLIASGVINAIDSGFMFQFLWPNQPNLNNFTVIFYGFSIFNLLFTQQILSLKKNAPVLHWICSFAIALMIFAVVLNLLGYYRIIMMSLAYYFYVVSLLYLGSGFYVFFKQKYRPAFYYMLAWSTYAFFAVVYIMAVEGVIPYNFCTQSALVIGNMLEITLLFLAVIDKIYEFRKAKDEATIESIRLMEENRQLLFEQNIRLEHMVKLRTHELEELNSEVQAQNEELNASQDQLATQNEVIQKQNRLLAKKKKILQRLVKKRTLALEVANETLLHKNNTLERFGYFTAHNIRGPVSSIMGLINLFRLVKDDQAEHDQVVMLLKQSTDKLDEVVRDMITLLDFNNAESITCDTISITSVYQESKETFMAKLPDLDEVTLVEDFKNLPCLADQVIVRFVFDQLFENSYKFRALGRQLEIVIQEEDTEEYTTFSFSDNGIGFEAEKFEKDLFGLYKKFHTAHFSGKGLGLYFVKEYMGRMNGKVSLTGMKGKGTTVKLYFAKPNND